MEKKYLIPTVIGVLLLCGIVFAVVYKKGNPSDNKPQVETLAPKETTAIETKTSGDKTDIVESSTEFDPDIVYLDSDGNEMEMPSFENELPLNDENVDVYENYENLETQVDLVAMAESYVVEQSIEAETAEDENMAQEFREVTDEVHQEFQNEIDEKTKEQAESLFNGMEAYYESYYANEGGE